MALQRYGDYRPTQFDASGASMLSERADWLVAPLTRTRDSGPLEESNFASALVALGGESETIEVHRFGHWGPGWYEIILINATDLARVKEGEDIEAGLEDYPVIDEMDLSERERAAYTQAWYHGFGCRGFLRDLVNKFRLRERVRLEDAIEDADQDKALSFFESLIPSGDYHGEDGYPRVRYAVEACGRSDLARFVRELRKKEAIHA